MSVDLERADSAGTGSRRGRHRRPLAGTRVRRLVRLVGDCLFGEDTRPVVLVPVLLAILALLVTIALTLSVFNAVLVAVVGIGLRCYCAGRPIRS